MIVYYNNQPYTIDKLNFKVAHNLGIFKDPTGGVSAQFAYSIAQHDLPTLKEFIKACLDLPEFTDEEFGNMVDAYINKALIEHKDENYTEYDALSDMFNEAIDIIKDSGFFTNSLKTFLHNYETLDMATLVEREEGEVAKKALVTMVDYIRGLIG